MRVDEDVAVAGPGGHEAVSREIPAKAGGRFSLKALTVGLSDLFPEEGGAIVGHAGLSPTAFLVGPGRDGEVGDRYGYNDRR